MRDAVEHNKKDVVVAISAGDCYGDGITLTIFQKEEMVVDEKIVQGFVIMEAAKFSKSDDSVRDFGYCVHMPEDQLLEAVRALGYKVEPPQNGPPKVINKDEAIWSLIPPEQTDPYTAAELRGNPNYMSIAGYWYMKTGTLTPPPSLDNTIDPEEHGIIQE